MARDRDDSGRPRNLRPRDGLGRPLPHGAEGVAPVPEDLHLDAAETLRWAQNLLDRGMPFQAHEVLEARWKTGPAHEREYWQGLAQAAVALTHVRRGNHRGARSLAQRAQEHLGTTDPAPGGAAIDAVSRQLKAIAQGRDTGLRIVSDT